MVSKHDIGQRIRTARQTAGLKRIQLAVAADLSANTIRNYEDGLTTPTLGGISAIARALGVDLIWLIDGDGIALTEEVA